MRGPWVSGAAVLLALAACNTTNTGNPIIKSDGDQGGVGKPTGTGALDSGYGNCDSKATELASLDAETELGITPNDVLTFAAGDHMTSIRWQAGGTATYAPESGEHALTLRIEPTGKKPTFVRYAMAKSAGNGAGPAIDIGLLTDCSSLNAIEIEVSVAVKSDGGALDEHVTATLTARDTLFARAELRFGEKLGGAFTLVSTNPPGYMLKNLSLALGLSPLGLTGSLVGTLEMTSNGGSTTSVVGGSTATTGGAIAVIGDDSSCDATGGLPVELSRKVRGFSGQDALDALGPLASIDGTWGDGSHSQFALRFEHDSQAICARLESGSGYGVYGPYAGAAGSLTLAGSLFVKSADGRIDAHFPVQLYANATEDGALGALAFELVSSKDALDGATLASQYGIAGIDATGYDNVFMSLALSLMLDGDAPGTRGMFVLNGAKLAPCAKEPPPPPKPSPDGGSSSPGCRGSDLTALMAITW